MRDKNELMEKQRREEEELRQKHKAERDLLLQRNAEAQIKVPYFNPPKADITDEQVELRKENIRKLELVNKTFKRSQPTPSTSSEPAKRRKQSSGLEADFNEVKLFQNMCYMYSFSSGIR